MKRLALAAIVSAVVAGCGRPAQIGSNEAIFKEVDALYTAVSLRDPKLLDECRARLDALKAEGKVPDDAARSLEGFIADAKGGSWEPAQERLATFMEGQRR